MQGAESEILRVCIETISNMIMLAHDGFVCRSEVDVAELAHLVKHKTGFTVTFSQARL